MKITKILGGIIMGIIVCNMSYATEMEEFCALDPENFSYVSETDACVPADPCSSSDAATVEKYCVTNPSSIPLDVNGTHYYAYNINDVTGEVCHDNEMYGRGVETTVCKDVKLKPGEWAVRFYYGTVKGTAMCSGESAETGRYEFSKSTVSKWSKKEDVLKRNAGIKEHCWCKVKGLYALATDSSPRTIFPFSSWVYEGAPGIYEGGNAACQYDCEAQCAEKVSTNSKFRGAIYYGGN